MIIIICKQKGIYHILSTLTIADLHGTKKISVTRFIINGSVYYRMHIINPLNPQSIIFHPPKCINPYPTKLIDLNFHTLEVVSRYRDPQPEVVEHY